MLDARDKVACDLVGRSVFLHVDLDAATNNIQCIRKLTKNKRAGMKNKSSKSCSHVHQRDMSYPGVNLRQTVAQQNKYGGIKTSLSFQFSAHLATAQYV